MIRKSVVAVLIALGVASVSSAEEKSKNYELQLEGKSWDLNLGEAVQVKTKSGETLSIVVKQKEFATFKDEFVTFQHRSELAVASHDLGVGVKQLMMNTATGTVVVVQEYSTLNPSMLVELMLNELTKQSVEYGHKMEKSETSRQLKSGKKFTGLKATLSYAGDEQYWEVVAYGSKDRGVIIATQIGKEFLAKEKPLLDMFWDSLDVAF